MLSRLRGNAHREEGLLGNIPLSCPSPSTLIHAAHVHNNAEKIKKYICGCVPVRMVTLGPMILLGLLGITFYVGFRRQRSSSHDGVTSFFRSQSRTRINTDITHMASSPGTQRHRKRPRAIGQWSSITFASWSQRTR